MSRTQFVRSAHARKHILKLGYFVIAPLLAFAQSENVVKQKPLGETVELHGELLPFLEVSIHAKVRSYVDRVLVDRGSFVKQGQLLVQLSAPEMQAQVSEAQSKVEAAESEILQAQAELIAEKSTYERMQRAAGMPGAIAANELSSVERRVAAAEAAVRSRQQASRAAGSALQALQEMEQYLSIAAPFSGVITERFVHPGALVGPGNDTALVTVQQLSTLRLVVPVPEVETGTIVNGVAVQFSVPAFPARTYSGKVARIAHVLDAKTRTMPVELDVANADGSLAPGMFPTVRWPSGATSRRATVGSRPGMALHSR